MLQDNENESKIEHKKTKKFERWLKNIFLDTGTLAKLQPIIFATMIFNLIYGTAYTIIGSVELSLFMGMTGVYSLIFGITKWYSLKKYNVIQNTDDVLFIQATEKKCGKNIAVCACIMSFLHFSLAVVCTFFFEENPANYSLLMISVIAGSAFVKITLATINSVRTRKNHSKIIHFLKRTDAANALISIGLTQRAILYHVDYEYSKIVSGVGGIFFSLCALAICSAMVIRHLKESGFSWRQFKKR